MRRDTTAESAAALGIEAYDELPSGYRFADGTRPSRVTQVLVDAGLVDYGWCSRLGLERGSAVHDGLRLALHGTLDWSTLDPRVRPYVNAGLDALQFLRADTEAVEQIVRAPLIGVAGRYDWRGTILGRTRRALVDWKSLSGGVPRRASAWQLAGYVDLCLEDDGTIVADRYTIALYPDGRFRVYHHADRADFAVFRAAALLARIRTNEGLNDPID